MVDAAPRPVPSVPGTTEPGPEPARMGVVGSGWRAEFFLRAAALMPDRFRTVGVVSRTAERGAEVTARWGAPTFRTVAELLAAERPDFVVVAVPWAQTPVVTAELVDAGVAVLAETPPAPDAATLPEVWDRVGASGLVQVAEHSPFLPGHQARLALARGGVIGQVGHVQVSSTHQYHAMSLVRGLLDVGVGTAAAAHPVTVTAHRFTAPLVDMQTRAGWTGATEPKDAGQTLAVLDLGDGRSALHDFTDNQWHNPLRENRILVRGSHGEVLDTRVTRWADPTTVLTSRIERRQGGIEQDMDGYDLDHLSWEGHVLYRNPFPGTRLSDDDLAVAELMARTAAWVRGDGAAPYPLAEALQDTALAFAMDEALATGRPVVVEPGPWIG